MAGITTVTPQPISAAPNASLTYGTGDSRLPIVNETAGLRLVLAFLPQRVVISGDRVLAQVEPGLYKKHRKRN